MPPPLKRADDRDARFFTALENAHPVAVACRAAGYTVPSVYRWRNEDADFAGRWADALVMGADLLEEEADRRGRDGTDEPVFHQGRQVGVKRRYSDGLLQARLKAVRPEIYRESKAALAPPAPQSIIIREFEMEEELQRLIDIGKVAVDDLEERPRRRLEKLRAKAATPVPDTHAGQSCGTPTPFSHVSHRPAHFRGD